MRTRLHRVRPLVPHADRSRLSQQQQPRPSARTDGARVGPSQTNVERDRRIARGANADARVRTQIEPRARRHLGARVERDRSKHWEHAGSARAAGRLEARRGGRRRFEVLSAPAIELIGEAGVGGDDGARARGRRRRRSDRGSGGTVAPCGGVGGRGLSARARRQHQRQRCTTEQQGDQTRAHVAALLPGAGNVKERSQGRKRCARRGTRRGSWMRSRPCPRRRRARGSRRSPGAGAWGR